MVDGSLGRTVCAQPRRLMGGVGLVNGLWVGE